jgi:hypothetical protein
MGSSQRIAAKPGYGVSSYRRTWPPTNTILRMGSFSRWKFDFDGAQPLPQGRDVGSNRDGQALTWIA